MMYRKEELEAAVKRYAWDTLWACDVVSALNARGVTWRQIAEACGMARTTSFLEFLSRPASEAPQRILEAAGLHDFGLGMDRMSAPGPDCVVGEVFLSPDSGRAGRGASGLALRRRAIDGCLSMFQGRPGEWTDLFLQCADEVGRDVLRGPDTSKNFFSLCRTVAECRAGVELSSRLDRIRDGVSLAVSRGWVGFAALVVECVAVSTGYVLDESLVGVADDEDVPAGQCLYRGCGQPGYDIQSRWGAGFRFCPVHAVNARALLGIGEEETLYAAAA